MPVMQTLKAAGARAVDAITDVLAERRWPRSGLIAASAAVALAAAWPLAMAWCDDIDDRTAIEPSAAYAPEGGSLAVAMAATLVERESARWTPNKPFWHPAASLDNMPNYQMGMLYAVSRFGVEMSDQLGRTRGTSGIDPDLDKAAGMLKTDGKVWYWGNGNVMPMAPAQENYAVALDALKRYNARVARGEAAYSARADNLISFLERVTSDLGAVSQALEERAMSSDSGWFDTEADDLLYNSKGQAYGYLMVLKGIEADFADVLRDKKVGDVWAGMMISLEIAAKMNPLIVINGSQDGLFQPSHLSAQGFYVLRARSKMKEVIDGLLTSSPT